MLEKCGRWAGVAGGLLRVRGGLGGVQGNLRGWSSSQAWRLGLYYEGIAPVCDVRAFHYQVVVPADLPNYIVSHLPP